MTATINTSTVYFHLRVLHYHSDLTLAMDATYPAGNAQQDAQALFREFKEEGLIKDIDTVQVFKNGVFDFVIQ